MKKKYYSENTLPMTRRKFPNPSSESAAIQQTSRQIHGVEMTLSTRETSAHSPGSASLSKKHFSGSYFSMNGRELVRTASQTLTFEMAANCNIIKKLLPIFILMNMLPLFYAGE